MPTDASAKLRYTVHGAWILAWTHLLPDALWRSLMRGGMTRRPKSSAKRNAGAESS